MSDATQASDGIVPWHRLEERTSTAFLVAGTLLLGFVASNALHAFTAVTPPRWVSVVFVVPGLGAGHLGLLGLYPRLSDRVPRHALVGAVVVAVAGVGGVGLLVVELGRALLPASGLPFAALSPLFYLVMLVATILGFVLLGTAAFRTSSRAVGLALLGPPAVFLVMTAGLVTGYTPEWSTFLVSALQAGAHFAVALALRGGSPGTDRSEPSSEPAAR